MLNFLSVGALGISRQGRSTPACLDKECLLYLQNTGTLDTIQDEQAHCAFRHGTMDYAELLKMIGRVLLGGLFVVGGIHHFFMLPALTSALVTRGVPMARVALIAASAFQVLAGLLFMIGVWVAPAAIGLVVFTLIASVLMLNFWDMEGPARDAARTGWQANLAIIGGLLIAAAQAL
jgi:putative oxidoreductase